MFFFRESRWGVLLLLEALVVLLFHSVDGDSRTVGGPKVQWTVLTKENYSSQIHSHHHLLLLVTVPWSGESRSLMNELARAVASDEHRFGALKLMVLNGNVERMLADSLGANGEITIFYHRNALAYKYSGRLRVQNILSSVHYAMSLLTDEIPFKALATPEDLKHFLHSTDKAIVLLDFCGWTQKLLAANGTTSRNNIDLNRMNDGSYFVELMDNRKDMENDELECSMGSQFNGLYWLSQLTSLNETVKDERNVPFDSADSCTEYELEQFKVFFQKFLVLVRDFFLPPERHRFALVSEKLLLPLLSTEEPALWLVAVYFAGCPSCSRFLNDADNVRSILQAHISPVLELEDVEAALPSEGPVMLLFVDMSSDSMQVRRESREALASFREFAQEKTEMHNESHGYQNMRHDRASVQHSSFKHPSLQTSPSLKRIILTDKMSFMIMKDGMQVTLKNIVPDKGSSVHEALDFALKQNQLKLSSVAKNVGLQLLSPDFEIEVGDSLSSKSEDQPDQGESPKGLSYGNSDLEENQLPALGSRVGHEKPHEISDVEPILIEDEVFENRFSPPEITDEEATGSRDEGSSSLAADNEDAYFSRFFYFTDGHYRLLEALTGKLKVPSVVIIDPNSQNHYVLAEHMDINQSTLSVFVKDFLDGLLLPYIQSQAIVRGSEDAKRAPFVNLDFHEKGSIPSVTSHTFSELVYGNTSDPKNSSNSLNKDVLVLFANEWCGFCQRMELVVREVYRAVRAYADLQICNTRKEKWMANDDHAEDTTSKLPLIYMMDCTLNDCSLITKRALQREMYPLLLLFPAGKKNETVKYEGGIAVCDIINFLIAHGSNVRDLILDESVLQDLKIVKQSPQSRSLHHEVILQDRISDSLTEQQDTPIFPFASHEKPHLSVGCILIATENLFDIHPFDEAKILIVKADESTGVQGLIINKPMSWDSLQKHEQYFELVKEAPLQLGGPVVIHGLPLVALTHVPIEGKSTEVLTNVHFIDPVGVLSLIGEIRAGNYSVHDFRFFLGYCGWGWEQLFAEIHRGDWNVTQGSFEWALS